MVSSDDDFYYISYTTSDSKEKEPVSYEVKNKILTLKEDSDSNSYTHIDIGFLTAFLSKDKDFTTDENVVTLYVPENAKFQNATLNSDLGNILLNHVCFESGTVSSGDGDIFIKNSTLKEVAVSASLGDVKTYDSKIKTCNFVLSDGDFTAKNNEFTGETLINDDLGNIEVQGSKKQWSSLGVDASTDLGDIEVSETLEGTLKENDSDESEYQRSGKNGKVKLHAEDGDITMKCN